MTEQDRMPAAFFGHGNPLNAIETNRYTAAWRAFGDAVPRTDTGVLIDGYAYGSLSMTAYTLGLDCPASTGEFSRQRPRAGTLGPGWRTASA